MPEPYCPICSYSYTLLCNIIESLCRHVSILIVQLKKQVLYVRLPPIQWNATMPQHTNKQDLILQTT